MTAAGTLDLLGAERMLAIVRTRDADHAVAALGALASAGVRVAEVSLSEPNGLEVFERCCARPADGLLLGAGTVRTVEQAEQALALGAAFLVAPGLDLDVLAFAAERDVLHLPGVLTPTEVDRALLAGAPALKLFPGDRLGPGYVTDLLGPFPGARLIPTGGIETATAPAYLAAGAFAVAFAGALAAPDAAGVAALARAAHLSVTTTVKERHAR
jgi:2-dehydro-3-deoxyphosphogluconate aldolase / (4S)-4-hydroxy-2-oxoglutarate aldolase